MSKQGKMLLGALTLLPIVFFGLYMFSFFQFFSEMTHLEPGSMPQEVFPENFFSLFIYIGLAVLLSIGLLVYYLIHISNNPKFKDSTQSSNKLVWILVVIFAGIVGMIAYFFVEIWPDKKDEPMG